MGCQVKISSHVYVPPGGEARHEICDFFYNGNDRCAGLPWEHQGWDGNPVAVDQEGKVALTVREYIHELNRLVIIGEVEDDAPVKIVMFNGDWDFNASKPRVGDTGDLIIFDG